MLELLGGILAVTLGVLGILGAIWRWIILPNLREQLVEPLRETRRQVTENKHRNKTPTILDRLDDIEQIIEAVGLNQQAIMRLQMRLGEHIGESTKDRQHLWLMVESLAHEHRQKGRHTDESGHQGGP